MYIKINLEQMKVYAYHGVYNEERLQGQYYFVDVELNVKVDEQGILMDDLVATYNYELLAKTISEEMQIPSSLLEKKALEISNKIKQSDDRIQNVKLKLTKPHPPMMGDIGSTSVEIVV
ncbi:MAG: dihydroneopterin aldolase [Chitinophagales bacterium]|nr:dihydroneopterin aldolase [Chitinophagales bacterium]